MSSDNPGNTFQDTCFILKRVLLGPYRVRRARIYGIGMGKTGTHSLALMFSRNVRAAHEPECDELGHKVLDWREGLISEQELAVWLRARDRRLALEVDSSGLNFQVMEILLREFPDAKFVMTLRDCYSWVNSLMNQIIARPKSGPWTRLWKYFYEREPFVHAPEEKLLKEHGLHTLDIYFAHWRSRADHVIATVPPEKLFIVRTDQLRDKAFEIADFAGLPRSTVRLGKTHQHKNSRRRAVVREIDRDFLERKVEQHCRPLMTKYFPEIRSLDDARV